MPFIGESASACKYRLPAQPKNSQQLHSTVRTHGDKSQVTCDAIPIGYVRPRGKRRRVGREDTRISSLWNVSRSRLTARPSVVFVALRLTLSNPSLRRTCPLLPGVVGYFGWFGKLRIRVALRLRPGLLYLAEVSCRKPPDRGTRW
jgi:hypothetical protein